VIRPTNWVQPTPGFRLSFKSGASGPALLTQTLGLYDDLCDRTPVRFAIFAVSVLACLACSGQVAASGPVETRTAVCLIFGTGASDEAAHKVHKMTGVIEGTP